MQKFVEGSYHSMGEVIKAVNALVSRGHAQDCITLITNAPKKTEIKKDTDLSVATFEEKRDSVDVLAEFEEAIENDYIVVLVKEESDEDSQNSNDMNTNNSQNGSTQTIDLSEEPDNVDLSDTNVPPKNSQRDINLIL